MSSQMTETMNRLTLSRILIPPVALATLWPATSSAMALLAGVFITLVLGNPYALKNWTHHLLTFSVVGLGAGMNLEIVARVGLQGIGYTVVSILTVVMFGLALRPCLKVDEDTGLLITVGTAICGGSAIAAITPVLRAKPHSVSVALGTVFILNAVALVIFPPIGHFLHLSEKAFGLWSALAIHDTSSVVGATVGYGPEAAAVGTTVKLARALWIVPVTFAIGWWKSGSEKAAGKAKKPWFILGFLLAAALVTWVPSLQTAGHVVEAVAKRSLVLTLFLIGLGLSRETLRTVGPRPFVFGVILWFLIGTGSLGAIEMGWMR